VFIGVSGIAEPHAARNGSDQFRDSRALVIREIAVDVRSELRACPAVGRRPVNGFESGELPRGKDGFGGVPVRLVASVAGFGVGTENLTRVIRSDLVLVTVGSDHGDMTEPLAGAVGFTRWLAECAGPGLAEADGGVGQSLDTGADQVSGVTEVHGQWGGLAVRRDLARAWYPGQQGSGVRTCRGLTVLVVALSLGRGDVAFSCRWRSRCGLGDLVRRDGRAVDAREVVGEVAAPLSAPRA